MIAAVISRLKDLVFASSMSPKFKVSLQDIALYEWDPDHQVRDPDEISWYWDELSEAQVAGLDNWFDLAHKRNDLQSQISGAENDLREAKICQSGGDKVADRESRLEVIRGLKIQSEDLDRQLLSEPRDESVSKQYYVRIFAIKADWEEHTESLAKRPDDEKKDSRLEYGEGRDSDGEDGEDKDGEDADNENFYS